MAVLILVSACDVMAIGKSGVPLEVRTQLGKQASFDPINIAAPASTQVALAFTNVSALEHNLVFLEPLTVRTREIIRPGEWERLEFRTPEVGSYEFVCTIHEGMAGTLVVH